MKTTNYRPEIDGLRAIAVLSVIIYHSGANQLTGGFIGVDIFYVISGYLITKIISSSLQNSTFSFSDFYARRMKRLLPAALFMIVMTVIIGMFFITPNNYIDLSKSAMSSSLFAANIWFMNNSGYFDLSTQVSPLVHMWSLSLEEQFYLVYPIILFLSYQINGLKGIKYAVFIIIATSLALSILLSSKFSNFSFYMLPTRAWELGIGAAITFPHKGKTNTRAFPFYLSITGICLIFYGLFTISHNDIYPGYLALIPVMGTALIIYSLTDNDNTVKKLLSFKPLLFMGKISYSAYLWHWPIIVYYRIYVNQRDFYIYEVLLLVASSIFVGYLSWRCVEERYRYRQYSSETVFTLALSATIIAISISGSIYLNKGFPERISDYAASITDKDLMWEWECTERINVFPETDETFCVVGLPWNQTIKKGIVWGDSHSQHWAQLLHYEALQQGVTLVIAPRKCPAYLNAEHVKSYYPKYPTFTDDCTQRNNKTLNWVKNNSDISVIIMASAWSGHVRMLYTDEVTTNKSNLSLEKKSADIGSDLSRDAFKALLPHLNDKKILLLGDIPRPNKILNECASLENTNLIRKECDDFQYRYIDSKTVLSWHRSSNEALRAISKEFANVKTLIPTDSLCDADHCQTYVNGELIYKDSNHIRRNLEKKTVMALSEKIGINRLFQVIWEEKFH